MSLAHHSGAVQLRPSGLSMFGSCCLNIVFVTCEQEMPLEAMPGRRLAGVFLLSSLGFTVFALQSSREQAFIYLLIYLFYYLEAKVSGYEIP